MERDSQRVPKRRRRSNFNSHAHVERDDFATGWIKAYCISTHTLTWSVTQLFWLQWFCHTISTHTLTWSVTCWQGEDNPCTVHFNSHAHVERDLHMNSFNVNMSISTHTLTWSVTFIGSYSGFKLTISTHTLTWSVTGSPSNSFAMLTFQLTRSRGAWQTKTETLDLKKNFNSHAHVERDENVVDMGKQILDFNSHAHVERDIADIILIGVY